jgi:tetratricopeptide (TPR) repeat protein
MSIARTKVNSTGFDYLGKRGMEHYNRGAYDRASMLFGRLLEQKPECIKSRTYYGLCLFWQKRFDEAISVLEECLAGNMIFQEIPLYIAYSYYQVGDCKSTISLCENFLLSGSVSRECQNCARKLIDYCQVSVKPVKKKTKSRRAKLKGRCYELFDMLLMRERELMRYF